MFAQQRCRYLIKGLCMRYVLTFSLSSTFTILMTTKYIYLNVHHLLWNSCIIKCLGIYWNKYEVICRVYNTRFIDLLLYMCRCVLTKSVSFFSFFYSLNSQVLCNVNINTSYHTRHFLTSLLFFEKGQNSQTPANKDQ